jgi:dihydroneopterin aldolase
MNMIAKVELRDLKLTTSIGSYGPNDVVPSAHLLDMTLAISPQLVHVGNDNMASVFDYDPLIEQIDSIARSQNFETQEYLITKITQACASHKEILSVDVCLRKEPVLSGTGSLGVRLQLTENDFEALRSLR